MAIRIPDGPSVETAQLRTVGPSLIDVPDVGGAVAQAGQQVGRAVADVGATMQKVEREADALRITQSLTEFERRTTNALQGETLGPIDAAFEGAPRRAGYLETKGLKAGEASQETLEELQKSLDEIGAKLLPRQQEAFYARANALREDARRRVEGHVASEFQRAKGDGVKAAKAETLRVVGADPRTPAMGLRIGLVDSAVDGLSTSPEDAAAEKAAFRGDVALVRIQALVGEGAVDEAEAVATEAKEWLGTRNDEVQALLRRARAGDEKKKLQVAATAQTQAWVKEATPAGGYVDESKVLLLLQSTPADDPKREALEVEVRQALQVEDARRKADTQKHREFVWRADLGSTQPPGSSIAFLEQFDPDFLRGLKNEREARWRRWKADKDGSAAERAAAARQQTLDDKLLVSEFASLPPEEQAKTTPEEFSKVLADKFPDFAPSRNGYGAARQHQRRTIEGLEKGDLTQERAFIAEAETEILPLVTRKGGKVDPDVKGDPRTTISGNASQFFRSKRAALGRDPTPDETQEWLGQLKLQPEVSWGKKPPPAVLRPDFMPGGFGAPLPAKPAVVAPPKTQRQAAEAWLSENPNHPKAASVRAKLESMK